MRYTGGTLPLLPTVDGRQFKEASPLCEGGTCGAEALSLMLADANGEEGFLAERMQDGLPERI